MKALALVMVAVGGGLLVWGVGSRLSADAVGMAVGLLFGMLPIALMLIVASGQKGNPENDGWPRTPAGIVRTEELERQAYARHQQPTVIVVTPQPQYTQARPFALPAPQPPVTIWYEPGTPEELEAAQRMFPRNERRYAVVPVDVAMYDGGATPAPKRIGGG
jgi:hypothetical protein